MALLKGGHGRIVQNRIQIRCFESWANLRGDAGMTALQAMARNEQWKPQGALRFPFQDEVSDILLSRLRFLISRRICNPNNGIDEIVTDV